MSPDVFKIIEYKVNESLKKFSEFYAMVFIVMLKKIVEPIKILQD